MGQTTGIRWTEATANFWWGCQRVSPGCEHCYPGARPFNLAWAHSIVAQCRAAGVACFVKQMGDNPVMEPGPITWPCTAHHGADPSEWPETLRVQEFPARRPA